MYETWQRSILKGITWFLIRFSMLFLITYLFTKDFTFAGYLSGAYYTAGAFTYFIHERGWNYFKYGRSVTNG